MKSLAISEGVLKKFAVGMIMFCVNTGHPASSSIAAAGGCV